MSKSSILLEIGVGRPYRFLQTGDIYEVRALGQAVPVFQEQVIYVGLTGPDKGRWYICSPWDFGVNFVSARPLPAAASAPATAIGPVEEALAAYLALPPRPAPGPATWPTLTAVPARELSSLDWYRASARHLADESDETVLLILEPRPSPIEFTVSPNPYSVLLSQVQPHERGARHERFEPAKEPA